MRVAFITNRPAYYRIPVFELLARRWEIDFFFTATDAGRYWTNDHPFSIDSLNHTRLGISARQLYREIRRGRYDCVITSLGGRAHLVATAAALRDHATPVVLWVGMWYYPRSIGHILARPMVRWLIRRADSVVAYGPHVATWLASEWGRDSSVFEFANAVDNSLFSRAVDPELVARTRDAFGLPGSFIACYVGRLEPEKGLPYLLHALALSPEGIGLVIIGSGSQEAEIVEAAHAAGVRNRVHLAGYVNQDNLPAYYRATECLVMPSVTTRLARETWGLVANEAMNAGLPVIATRAVGAAAGGLIVNDLTGIVVPEKSAEGLAAALTLLSGSQDTCRRLGDAAAKRVKEWSHTGAASAFEKAVVAALDHASKRRLIGAGHDQLPSRADHDRTDRE